MVDDILYKYTDCLSTIKETSTDDAKNTSMFDSKLKVYDFDKIKEKYSKNYELFDTPSSNDALFFNNKDDIYFIEFKNGKIDRTENGKIKFKFLESILIFLDIIKKDLDYSRNNVKYILVYNYEANYDHKNFNDKAKIKEVKNHRVTLGQALMKLAKEEFVRFDLARYKNIYVKEVHTYNTEEFKSNFLEVYDVISI